MYVRGIYGLLIYTVEHVLPGLLLIKILCVNIAQQKLAVAQHSCYFANKSCHISEKSSKISKKLFWLNQQCNGVM